MADLVWYAGYGSNLSRGRFACYLGGGAPVGASRRYPGCADPSDPRDDRPTRLPFGVYFAGRSRTWGGGVAFVGRARGPRPPTLARMYLITTEQLRGVVAQENRDTAVALDLDRALETPRHVFAEARYGALLRCGDRRGIPIVTFTAGRRRLPVTAPTLAYLRVMAAGLAESHGLDPDGVVDYLCRLPGVRPRYSARQLRRRLAERHRMVAPPRHSSPS